MGMALKYLEVPASTTFSTQVLCIKAGIDTRTGQNQKRTGIPL